MVDLALLHQPRRTSGHTGPSNGFGAARRGPSSGTTGKRGPTQPARELNRRHHALLQHSVPPLVAPLVCRPRGQIAGREQAAHVVDRHRAAHAVSARQRVGAHYYFSLKE